MNVKESPEEALIRTIREMQKHHLECMTDSSRPTSVDAALNLAFHKNMYTVLTELIDQYDDDVAAQNAPKEGMKAE